MVTRRTFIGGLAATGLAAWGQAPASGRILFGACRGFGDAQLLKEIGFDFIEGGVSGALLPDKDGDDWKRQREKILNLPLPLRSCNGFIPRTFRLTGDAASFDAPLAYAEKACRRADEVGLQGIADTIYAFANQGIVDGFGDGRPVCRFLHKARRAHLGLQGPSRTRASARERGELSQFRP